MGKALTIALLLGVSLLAGVGVFEIPPGATLALAGIFSFGANKSKSSSQSTAHGLSIQGSSSLSDSLSQSTSQGQSTQQIAFADLFANLYGDAAGAAGRAALAAPGLSQQAQMLFSGGLNFLDVLGGGAGEDYLAGRVSGDDGLLEQQIGGLGEDIGRFLREEVNPAIASRGVQTGTLGGSRQGVAQGRAADAATREFQRGATELRAQDRAQRDAAAQGLMAGRTAAAGTGLAALPQLQGVSERGFGAELAPYQALAQIMGGPTTLTTSQQSSDAMSIAQAIAQSFGLSEDYSQSTSTSKGSGFNFGGGQIK